jgi:hypothetical protein
VGVAVHRRLEKNGPGNAIAAERRAGDDARPHGVDQVHHLRLAGIGVFGNAVQLQRLRGAATALIQGGNEARLVADLGGLLFEIAHESSLPMEGVWPCGKRMLGCPNASGKRRQTRTPDDRRGIWD